MSTYYAPEPLLYFYCFLFNYGNFQTYKKGIVTNELSTQHQVSTDYQYFSNLVSSVPPSVLIGV